MESRYKRQGLLTAVHLLARGNKNLSKHSQSRQNEAFWKWEAVFQVSESR